MIGWIALFTLMALAAAALGFGGIVGFVAMAGQVLFVVLLLALTVALIASVGFGRRAELP